MQFAVGDKVVHPHHGPGRINRIEQKEFVEGRKQYYVIEIPDQGLMLYVPMRRVTESGIRPAMARAQITRMLATLRGLPRRLPPDYKERQELVLQKLNTGDPIQIAEALRDLAWHQKQEHLTRKDAEYLDRGRQMLAAELALVWDLTIADGNKTIDTTLANALDDAAS